MIQTKKINDERLVKWKMYLLTKDGDVRVQKLRELINIISTLSRKESWKSTKMFCSRRNVWDMKGKEYKEKIIILESIRLRKFTGHALMIKDIYSMMGTKHCHMALRIFVSYIKIIQRN